MVKRILLPALIVATLIAPIASAQIVIKPRPQTPGSFETKTEFNLKQTLSIMGNDIDTSNERSVTSKTVVGEPDSDGNVTYTETTKTFVNKVTLPGGNELVYDSSGENKPQGTQLDFLLPVYDSLAKATVTVVYNKDGDIKSAKITSAGLENLDAQAKAILGSDLDEDNIKKKLQQAIDEYHAQAVSPGDNWKATSTIDLGSGAVFTLKSTQKYIGIVEKESKKLHQVEITFDEVDFEQPAATPGAAAVTDSDLEITTGKAVFLFDAEKGQVISRDLKLSVKGDITLTVADMELPAELKLDITMASKKK